ncbi:MAG: L-ribulose-5-phosphate 4-epimerase AraD [Prevotellaceae bacterium]|jgi:L-ribulose-5-phosphate 4-epimerase|nr:L-ribulose-5-phosphate 4-epimerase AraD [Prevotellaceae bacterium]
MLAFKEQVYNATIELIKRQTTLQSWGNISAVDRKSGVMVIKPHKTNIQDIRPGDMVVMNLQGKVLDGLKKPSFDALTHLVIYNSFPEIGAIAHTHSMYASCWAQAGQSIPPLGITHIDRFYGEIPCTRELTDLESEKNYEEATGHVIVEALKDLDPFKTPAVLVNRHGPFVWGKDLDAALRNASVIEEIAGMAYITLQINPQLNILTAKQVNVHYERYLSDNN